MTVQQVARSRGHTDHGNHSSSGNNINRVGTGNQGNQEVNGELSNHGTRGNHDDHVSSGNNNSHTNICNLVTFLTKGQLDVNCLLFFSDIN